MKKSIALVFQIVFTLHLFAQTTGYKVGDKAIDFKLKGVDGKMHSLPDFKKNKGAIVVFTCNTCPFAQAYEQRIIDLHKKFAPKGFPVVAINPNDPGKEPDEDFAHMVQLAKEHKYPFPYLVDATQQIAKTYGAVRTPHIFLLNKSGKVAYIGAIDDNFDDATQVQERYLENAINALLAGKKPSPEQTKAIGCGIKWKK